MSEKRKGPKLTVTRSCDGCRYEASESYAVQGDSGFRVLCEHPHVGGRRIGDTTWTTPEWCPERGSESAPESAALASEREARQRAEQQRDEARAQWGAELLVERDMLASSLEGRGSTFDLAAWFDAKARWSAETFGPENGPQRYEAVVAHIRKELVEVERDPTDLEEWCDVAMLAMDGAWRSAGADGAAFVAMLEEKHAINIVRVWRRGADGTIEHVREEVAVLEDDGDPA